MALRLIVGEGVYEVAADFDHPGGRGLLEASAEADVAALVYQHHARDVVGWATQKGVLKRVADVPAELHKRGYTHDYPRVPFSRGNDDVGLALRLGLCFLAGPLLALARAPIALFVLLNTFGRCICDAVFVRHAIYHGQFGAGHLRGELWRVTTLFDWGKWPGVMPLMFTARKGDLHVQHHAELPDDRFDPEAGLRALFLGQAAVALKRTVGGVLSPVAGDAPWLMLVCVYPLWQVALVFAARFVYNYVVYFQWLMDMHWGEEYHPREGVSADYFVAMTQTAFEDGFLVDPVWAVETLPEVVARPLLTLDAFVNLGFLSQFTHHMCPHLRYTHYYDYLRECLAVARKKGVAIKHRGPLAQFRDQWIVRGGGTLPAEAKELAEKFHDARGARNEVVRQAASTSPREADEQVGDAGK